MEESGIIGNVFWIEGNQMPMMLDENEPGEMGREGKNPIPRTIYIHALTPISKTQQGEDGLFSEVGTALLKEVQTDMEGKFKVGLPPGMYSLFTLEEKGLFANVFDRDNHINPVEVKKGKWAELDIVINYKAVY
ncbi:carboxypeptidase regulatory-like domain-containing protein [Pararhodonellum marinum]|uniref:carboxypeptidase regulatory-like domain-containing protein n=1 Tax=Pararhodonellum marinum TaxID=2755358 RepID=UPI0018900C75|nr:carboxypeptidase regulatory-like domain-containing protein [Pararhodonellum marinum]